MSSPTVVPTTSTESVPASRRWLARAALAALLAAIVVIVAAEGLTGLTLTVVGLVGAALVLAGGYWFIAKRGVLRWIGLALAARGDRGRHRGVLPAGRRRGRAGVAGPAGRWVVRRPGRRCAATTDQWMPTTTGRAGPAAVHRDEPAVRRRQGRPVRPDRTRPRRSAPRSPCWTARATSTSPRWSGTRSPTAPTCSGSPAVTAPRRWSPASPPSTTSRCW